MKKVPIEVHRTSANTAQFLIPAHLDAMEVRGIIESVMERLMLEGLKSVPVVLTNDFHTKSFEAGFEAARKCDDPMCPCNYVNNTTFHNGD